jgi:hypothetical protein
MGSSYKEWGVFTWVDGEASVPLKLNGTVCIIKAQHDGDAALEHTLHMGNHSQWGHYRGMEAVRPPLFFFCLFLVIISLYLLGLVLWAKRDGRQRNAN